MSDSKIARGLSGLIAALCVSTGVIAQEVSVDERIEALKAEYESRLESVRSEYEARMQRLESRLGGMQIELERATMDEQDRVLEESITGLIMQEGRGAAGSGHSLFDSALNPSVSVVADFLFAASNRDDSFATLDQFIVRSVELGVAGRVDRHVAYYAFIHFGENEIELEEAFGHWDQGMPGTFSLKAGHYNVNFGRLSPIHDEDLPFIDKPQVLQDYLGGSLRGTGVELHHSIAFGEETSLLWSVGVVNFLDGDAHAVFGPLAGEDHDHDDDGAEPFGERDLDDFAFTGRVLGLFTLGHHSTLQVGASVAWAPGPRGFYETATGAVRDVELDRLVLGTDVAFSWRDPESGEGLTLAGELLLSDGDSADFDATPGPLPVMRDVTSIGVHAYGEYHVDHHWSVGASGGWLEHRENDDLESWDLGAFVTWRVSDHNRLRLEGRYFDDPSENYWGLMLQWTVFLGGHSHWEVPGADANHDHGH